ncbi:MAG: hypothetical protein K2I13_06385, partial [Alistipes sp.]|nr:hypothetical protein [Alistipes sp.]
MQTGSQPLSDTHAALRTPVSAVAHTRNGKYRIRRFHAAKLNQLFFSRIRAAGIYQQIIANFNKPQSKQPLLSEIESRIRIDARRHGGDGKLPPRCLRLAARHAPC